MSHRTANVFIRRKMRREFGRYVRQRRRSHELYDPPWVKAGNAILKLGAWLLVSFLIVLIVPPIVKAIIIGFWLIIFTFIASLVVGPVVQRRRVQQRVATAFPEPAPLPTKLCPGPLDNPTICPCNKAAQIGLDVERCAYCQRLRPERLNK